jgi:hypothetical protein
MPLSTSEFILTHLVRDGVVDSEPVAIAIKSILMASPCGQDPGWTDLTVSFPTTVPVETGPPPGDLTIATPFGDLVPVASE